MDQTEQQKLDNVEKEAKAAKEESLQSERMQKVGDAKPDAAPAVPDA